MVIDTLLKKAGLDSKIYKNYQPVINLLFLRKLTERIVKKRIHSHMEAKNIRKKKAFGYRTGYSTGTFILGVRSGIEWF